MTNTKCGDKNNKADSPENIPAELFKHDGFTLHHHFYYYQLFMHQVSASPAMEGCQYYPSVQAKR